MTAPVSCPCCGAEVQAPFVWDVASGRFATARGTTPAFHPREILLLDALVLAEGRLVPHSRCIEAMYRVEDEPEDIAKALQVRVCRLNKELRKIGARIVNEIGRGYRLPLLVDLEVVR